jgi:hypothetical protein
MVSQGPLDFVEENKKKRQCLLDKFESEEIINHW